MKLFDYLNSLSDDVKSVLISISSHEYFEYFDVLNGINANSDVCGEIWSIFILEKPEGVHGKATVKNNVFVEYK